MSFPSDQTLFGSVAVDATVPDIVLPRTGASLSSGIFQTNDGFAKMTLSHQYASRTRRVARIDYSEITPDPLLTGVNVKNSMAVYTVVDIPSVGFTIGKQQYIVGYLVGWLGGNTFANTTKWLGGES
jgi:hypothetical protein